MNDVPHNGPPRPLIVCCGVLEAELRSLLAIGELDVDLWPVEGGLCTNVPALGRILRRLLAAAPRRPSLLAYGLCLPNIDGLAARHGVRRIAASNCVSMLLGEAQYTRAVARGTFFLLPQWAPHWQSVVEQDLGLHPDVGAALLQQELSEAVYLDTGTTDYPTEALARFAAYSGLPVRRHPVTLDHLATLLIDSLAKFSLGEYVDGTTWPRSALARG